MECNHLTDLPILHFSLEPSELKACSDTTSSLVYLIWGPREDVLTFLPTEIISLSDAL